MTLKLIISRYSEDVSWIKDYSIDYEIFNKGEPLQEDYRSRQVENVGENQKDIFAFIVENYESLPDTMAFVQGNPFDHCKSETFDRLIKNTTLTRLEDYTHTDGRNLENGLYFENNDSWYIHAHNSTHNQTCQFPTFDSFMSSVFSNYNHIDRIPFSPGSQILFEKERALYYPKSFWEHLNNILIRRTMTEGHILERAMYLIFSNFYIVREEFK